MIKKTIRLKKTESSTKEELQAHAILSSTFVVNHRLNFRSSFSESMSDANKQYDNYFYMKQNIQV